jgi:signal transduction histidine kinase
VIRHTLPRLFRAATFRFSAAYVAVFVASACLLGLAVFAEARTALRQQLEARVTTETAFLTGEARNEGLSHLLRIVSLRGRGATALDYLVQGANGQHLAGEIPAKPGLRPGWATLDVPEDGGARPVQVRALVSELDGGLLLAVGSDLGQLDELEEAVVAAFVGTTGLVAILGIIGGVLLSRAFLHRVDAISRTAEAIIGGDLSHRIPLRGTGDDLDRLAGTLNLMLDRISVLMESLRQVSSDVAHDLRTPLTRLFQRLEATRLHARSIADYQAAVEAAIGDTQDLLDTFSALLRIAQVEGGSPRREFATLDLAALAETVADAYAPDAEASGHALMADIHGPAPVNGDKELIVQAIANLVENALRHTPPGTRIAIRVGGNWADGSFVAVEDTGPGVPADDLPRLTDRFYRGERSRTMPGNGLGLSLVAAVASLHAARLSIERTEPGLRVALRFPASDVAPVLDQAQRPAVTRPNPTASGTTRHAHS